MNKLIKRAQCRDADAFTELMQSQMQRMYKTEKACISGGGDRRSYGSG